MNDAKNPHLAGGLWFDSPGPAPLHAPTCTSGPQLWFQARATRVCRIPGGVLLQVPYLPAPKECPPFETLFESLPPDRVSAGTLQLGDWGGKEQECELPVELRLGPDGQVWAQVGQIEDLPLRSPEARERQARLILDDFLEAYASWAEERKGEEIPAKTLRTSPAWQLTGWLSQSAPQTPSPMDALMLGVLGELAALGFRTTPLAGESPDAPEREGHGAEGDPMPAEPEKARP